MTHHLKDASHKHDFRQYVLKDEHGIFYKGYRCVGCGASGYEVPAAGPSRKREGGATKVGGDGGPSTPPTAGTRQRAARATDYFIHEREDRG